MRLIKEALTEYYGERCPDYVKGCACCDAWKELDDLLLIKSVHEANLFRNTLRPDEDKDLKCT